MRLETCQECVGSSPRVSRVCQDDAREFARRKLRLVGRLLGVAEKLTGMGFRREFAKRFTEGIGKLTGNTLGDHREKTRGTYTGGYRIGGMALTDQVFDLVLEVIAFLRVTTIIMMETTVVAPIPLLGSGLHRIRCLEESFFPDLEKDFSLGRIERGVRESRNGRLGPLHSSSRGSRRWGSGRIGSRSLLVLTFACY
ncbi:hypothetical protein BHE74_00024850 [Ensete ventricosum]|nr:hypothetical protein BHE74_00024850 [Ensete ventricosum]